MVFDITMVENEKPTRFVHICVSTNATMSVDRAASTTSQNLTGHTGPEKYISVGECTFPIIIYNFDPKNIVTHLSASRQVLFLQGKWNYQKPPQ